jgi:GNAT superfamily N-acetyltransferase
MLANPEAFTADYDETAAHPAEWWATWVADRRTFIAVDADDRWLGIAIVRPIGSGRAVVNAMWVAPEARRRGAARALCEACTGWATAFGCRTLEISVVEGNTAARRAYETAGFSLDRVDGAELVLARSLKT